MLALVIVSASTMSFRHASPIITGFPIETFGNDKSALAETMIKAFMPFVVSVHRLCMHLNDSSKTEKNLHDRYHKQRQGQQPGRGNLEIPCGNR